MLITNPQIQKKSCNPTGFLLLDWEENLCFKSSWSGERQKNEILKNDRVNNGKENTTQSNARPGTRASLWLWGSPKAPQHKQVFLYYI